MSEIGKGHEVVATETQAAVKPSVLAAKILGQGFELVRATTDDSGHEIKVGDHVHFTAPDNTKKEGTVKKVDGNNITIHATDGKDYTVDHLKVHDDDAH